MAAADTAGYEIDVEEVEYLRHGDSPLSATIYRPRGPGPFPAVIEAHGGAWCEGHRKVNEPIHLPVARGGVVVMAVDFRVPPQASYPGSVADINYAVRWLKRNAARYGSSPERVGAMGTSSGAHLVVLAAMKPDDPRYAAIPLAGAPGIDARVPYVVALWPVICPLGRYLDRKSRPAFEQVYQGRGGAVGLQDKYWVTEEAMGEGSPLLALERGDRVEKPQILYVQNPADQLHPRPLMERFVERYRQAGGKLDLHLYEAEAYDAIRTRPTLPSSMEAVKRMVDFIHSASSRAPGTIAASH